MYYNGQTLVHKEKNFLARLATQSDSSFHWDIREDGGTELILEDGTGIIDNLNNYTHIEDEWGNAYANQPAEGQFVDESAKKYLVSEEEKAAMREIGLQKIRVDAQAFSERILELLMSPKETDISKRYKPIEQKFGNFSLTYYAYDQDLNIYYSQNESKWFDFIEFFAYFLDSKEWQVKWIIKTRSSNKIIDAFIATKEDKTLFWNRGFGGHSIDFVEVERI